VKSRRNKGRFAGIPHRVMDSEEFRGLSGSAVKLLLAMTYQYNSKNNGDLTAAFSYMREKRGFRSPATLSRSLKELLQAELIIKTRHSLFQKTNNKCALFALSWFPIDECSGKLDVKPTKAPHKTYIPTLGKTNQPIQKLNT
jgi:hypothetical protein